MCGIFGIVNFDEKPVLKESLKIMSDKMIHRGPDDEGMLIDGNVGIGMRRLSIIDIEKGHQPISMHSYPYSSYRCTNTSTSLLVLNLCPC